jgi:ribosome-binding factor A
MTPRPAKEPTQRQLRVGEEIRHALAGLIARGELHDPLLFDVALTVSEVRLSPDLKAATVYVMPLGGAGVADVLAGLKRAAPWLRGRLAREVRLKFAPELHFAADTAFDNAQRIGALIGGLDIEDRQDEAGERDDGDGA